MTTRARILCGLAVLGAVCVLIYGVYRAESGGGFRDREAAGRTRDMLTRPLRLEATSARMVDEFLEGIQTFHYRASALGEATYRDRFYDTPEGDLHRAGYSYRFRERLAGRDGSPWSVRLERRRDPDEAKRLDVRSEVSEKQALGILAGNRGGAVTGMAGLPAVDRLRGVLGALGVDEARLEPRLIGELARRRLELTDKGRAWFELDVEVWTFRAPGSEEAVSFTDVVLDTRLKKGDAEIERRVNTMDMLVRTMFAFEETDLSPAERALRRLRLE